MANKSEAKVYFIIDNHVFLSAMLSVHVYNFSIHAIITDEMTTDRPLYLHNKKNNFSWKSVLFLYYSARYALISPFIELIWDQCFNIKSYIRPKRT